MDLCLTTVYAPGSFCLETGCFGLGFFFFFLLCNLVSRLSYSCGRSFTAPLAEGIQTENRPPIYKVPQHFLSYVTKLSFSSTNPLPLPPPHTHYFCLVFSLFPCLANHISIEQTVRFLVGIITKGIPIKNTCKVYLRAAIGGC